MTDNEIWMMPNYEVEPDQTLTVLSFYRWDGSLKGRMVHYPCHANLSKDNELYPDYPGAVLEQLDGQFPGSISIFLQGCTADMRPNCVLGNQFRAAGAGEEKMFEIESFSQKIGALSTYANAYVMNCIVVEAINMLVKEGINPPVWRSGNCPGGDEWNNQFIDRFKDRIRCL